MSTSRVVTPPTRLVPQAALSPSSLVAGSLPVAIQQPVTVGSTAAAIAVSDAKLATQSSVTSASALPKSAKPMNPRAQGGTALSSSDREAGGSERKPVRGPTKAGVA